MTKKNTTSAPRRARQYKFAPIREAVIEIRVTPTDSSSLGNLKDVFKGENGKLGELHETQGEIVLSPFGSATHHARKQLGFILQQPPFTYQVKYDGFIISRLGLYRHWKEFRDEARRMWNKYREIQNQSSVERIGLRYVNRLDIPADVGQLSKYVHTFPHFSNEIGEKPEEFFLRIAFPLHSAQAKAVVNEALIDKTETGISVVLDIDVFRDEALPTDEKGLWSVLDKLRVEKNKIFEGSITEKSRNLFNNANSFIGISSGGPTSLPNRTEKALLPGKRRAPKATKR